MAHIHQKRTHGKVEEETAIETVAKDKAETGMPYWLIVVIIVAVIAVAVVGIVFGIRFFKKKSEDSYYFDEEDEETVEQMADAS